MTATANEPLARHSKRRRRSPRDGLLVFLVLALGAAVAGFVVRAQAERPPGATAPASAPASASASASGPIVAPAAYVLSAEATAEVRAARFRISTTRAPASAVLTLDPAGEALARSVPVDLAAESTEVLVRGLAVGRTAWTVSAPGAPTVRGNLLIPATRNDRATSPDLGTATLLPGSAAPSAAPQVRTPDTETDTGPGTGQSVPTGPTGSTPPSIAPSTPRPTPTPRPTGPASPYDPDDN